MDFLQHTNETITNSEESPLSLFSPFLYHMLWTLHSAKLPTICVKMLERHKNTNIKTQATTTRFHYLPPDLLLKSSLFCHIQVGTEIRRNHESSSAWDY
jgi:hypothetical protein